MEGIPEQANCLCNLEGIPETYNKIKLIVYATSLNESGILWKVFQKPIIKPS